MVTALFKQCFQMFVIQLLSQRDVFVIPTASTGFIPANQQQGTPARIKCIQDAVRPPGMLHPQLSQAAMPGALDVTAVGEAKAWPQKAQ
jgi:uncharacterized protein with NAD-binding domain and iron-sulfur cluster